VTIIFTNKVETISSTKLSATNSIPTTKEVETC